MAESPTNVGELVAQLPATDAEADPGRKTLPSKPAPASKFTGPGPEASAKLAEAVLAGGRAALVELIGLVRDPAGADFQSYKAEYLLHCVALHVGQPGKEAARKAVVAALASQLTNDALVRYVRGFLLRELQWMADAGAAAALGAVLTDPQLCADAAGALVAVGGDAAAQQFRAAWPKTEGASRLTILHGLATLRDTGSAGVFREALGSSDVNLRLTAAWGLAQIADAASAGALLKLADAEPSYERIKAASACLLLAERLTAAGHRKAAKEVYAHLRDTRQAADERHIHNAAGKALAAIEAEE